MRFVGGLVLGTAVILACGESEQTSGPASPTVTLPLGDTIPLGTTVRINQGGTYPLPMGARVSAPGARLTVERFHE